MVCGEQAYVHFRIKLLAKKKVHFYSHFPEKQTNKQTNKKTNKQTNCVYPILHVYIVHLGHCSLCEEILIFLKEGCHDYMEMIFLTNVLELSARNTGRLHAG